MSEDKTFYLLTQVDSGDEYGDDARMCIVTVTPERLKIWEHALASVMSLKAEQADVFKLTLNTVAADFIGYHPTLNEIVDEEPILVKSIPIEWTEDASMRGHLVNIYTDGEIGFECHNKHSGVEYWSKHIQLEKLLKPTFDEVEWPEIVEPEAENVPAESA